MAHILYKLGAAALQPRRLADKVLPPLIQHEEAMQLREQFYKEGVPWPYEHIVPGEPKYPPGSAQYAARKAARDAEKQARLKQIQEAMAKMPQMVAEYRESRRFNWDEVDSVDLLTMTRTAIRRKYIRRKKLKSVSGGGG